MKKILTLLIVLLTTVCASAATSVKLVIYETDEYDFTEVTEGQKWTVTVTLAHPNDDFFNIKIGDAVYSSIEEGEGLDLSTQYKLENESNFNLLNVEEDSPAGNYTFTVTKSGDIYYITVTEAASSTPDYLCFTAEEAGATVALNFHTFDGDEPGAILEYSTDGTTWNNNIFTMSGYGNYTGTTITLKNVGDKVYFRAKENITTFSLDEDNYYYFSLSENKKVAASGNVMSLIDPTCKQTSVPSYCFTYLFYNCKSLTTAPELPATTLEEKCYYSMFIYCTSLTATPELPAKTLAEWCYNAMFYCCTSLTTAPELPAKELAQGCYSDMFYGCTSLTTAPELPATTLAEWCYAGMFRGCTSLTTAPELPAKTLEQYCYYFMFMDCSKLNKVTVNFTDWNVSDATTNWLAGVDSPGTFTCPAGLEQKTGDDFIPDGWTVIKPATEVTLSEDDETCESKCEWDESKTYDITLNRTMKANQWNTLCLPYDMTADEVTTNFGSDVTLMKMTGIENNVVNFETATTIEPAEAYIVKPTAAISQIKVTGKTGLQKQISTEHNDLEYGQHPEACVYFGSWTIESCFYLRTQSPDASEPIYVLSNDKFYTIDNEVEVKGYRWEIWDESGDNARALTLSLDGVATGIENVNADVNANKANGKFIENGRMVIVKDNKKFNVNGQEVK